MEPEKKLAMMPTDYSPAHWQAMKEMAKEFHASGALPAHLNNAARVVMVLQAGAEMGIPPMQAVNTLYIVNGKVAMEGRAMLKKLKLGGIKVTWKESTDTKCTVVLERDGEEAYEESFTIEEAARAKLTAKDNWTKFPKVMLRWRALAQAQRFYCPDVTEGLYLIEEMADVNNSGAKYGDEGVITIESSSPLAAEIIKDIEACTDRKAYMAEILPKINEVKGLSYNERASITKAAEAKLVEFAKTEALEKGKKDVKSTKEALEKSQDAPTDEEGDAEPETPEEAATDEPEGEAETQDERVEMDETDLEKVIKKIRSMPKQTNLISYIQQEVNAMPFDAEQRKEIRKWVSNKIAQINGAIPDDEDLKMIFGN